MPRVVIIGGGPAGSMAALLLARAGRDVLVVEQHRFPRPKVCGECISALGAAVLQRAGLLGRVIAAGATELRRCALHAPSGRSAMLPLPSPMYGLSRGVLDGLLLDAAVAAGAELHQPARCESIDDGPVVRDLRSNTVRRLAVERVIVSDGRGALLHDRPAQTGDFGISAHFVGVAAPRDAIHLYGVSGHYGGAAPIENGQWNIAFSVPRARVRPRLDELLEELRGENAIFRRHLSNARRVGPWRASPLARFGIRLDWPAGVIPIGNALAAVEPIGGEGMGLALRSAELVATYLAGGLVDESELRGSLARLYALRSPACRLAARVVARAGLCGLAASVVGSCTWLAAPLLYAMGKGVGGAEAASATP